MRGLVALAMGCLPAFAVPAHACSEPSFYGTAPDGPSSYEKPDVPYCLQDYRWSGRHTCDEWELNSYQREVDDYVRKLNDYIREANTFAEEAIAHAESAADYARCQAREVSTQHQ